MFFSPEKCRVCPTIDQFGDERAGISGILAARFTEGNGKIICL
jgi:hypothetical protein